MNGYCERLSVIGMVMLILSSSVFGQTDQTKENWSSDKLLEAARQGNVDNLKFALAAGVDVNSKTDYGATALFYACDRGHEEIVELLLQTGADPNAKDTFYNATPLTWAQQKGHQKIVLLLVKHGVEGADRIFINAVNARKVKFAKALLETGNITKAGLIRGRKLAGENENLLELFAGSDVETEPIDISKETLSRYAGKYIGNNDVKVHVAIEEGRLMLGFGEQSKSRLDPLSETEFLMGSTDVRFEMDGENVSQLKIIYPRSTIVLKPLSIEAEKEMAETRPKWRQNKKDDGGKDKSTNQDASKPNFALSSTASLAADREVSSANWPGFRGNGARGVAEGQNPPITWSYAEENEKRSNVKWRTELPGLGLSCPSIWGNHVYLTTAVNDKANNNLRTGLYGDVASVDEDFEFEFLVFCLDKNSGEIVWQRSANKKKPAVKRHAKSSHANPTVATDGKHVVAFFASEGLFCYSSEGDLLWSRDLGLLDSGWFYDPGYQWGFGSSPVIWDDKVVIQCDIQKGSFVAALDISNGNEIWRTDRDEIPSWSTPTVHQFGDVAMLLTHGTKAARGYDARSGELLWSLPEHSEIVVPTPFVAHDLIFVASGYSPIQPIYAIRPDARGEIRLDDGESSTDSISWGKKRGGPYMPTPIVYGDYLYCCANSGILTCYHATTGKQVYKKRMRAAGGSLAFTASPLAADGHIYFTDESGRVLVVKAGPEYELVETNPCNERVLATPAISDGVFYLRTQKAMMAFAEEPTTDGESE